MWMPPRLNSRNIEAEDEIFNGGPLRSIARARRLATIQRWNVPEVRMHRSSDPCVVLFLTALRCVRGLAGARSDPGEDHDQCADGV